MLTFLRQIKYTIGSILLMPLLFLATMLEDVFDEPAIESRNFSERMRENVDLIALDFRRISKDG